MAINSPYNTSTTQYNVADFHLVKMIFEPPIAYSSSLDPFLLVEFEQSACLKQCHHQRQFRHLRYGPPSFNQLICRRLI